MERIRFATIGSSAIAQRFVEALAETPEAVYVGAYSRTKERARAFGEARGATHFYDEISDLARAREIDAVYVASPNALHAQQALALIAGGKHVLVEKAFASNRSEASRVFAAAHEANVMCMEAMRNIHTPGFHTIEQTLGQLGQIRSASFRFSKVTSRVARLRAGERLNLFDTHLSGGALMDIGVYCVEAALALFGRPQQVLSASVTSHVIGEAAHSAYANIDLCGDALLRYADKVVSLSYGKVHDDVIESEIAGEDATLIWHDTCGPWGIRLMEHEDKGMIYGNVAGEGKTIESLTVDNDMIFELNDFIAAVQGEATARECVARSERITLDSLAVMDEIRRQAGVRFVADDAQGVA